MCLLHIINWGPERLRPRSQGWTMLKPSLRTQISCYQCFLYIMWHLWSTILLLLLRHLCHLLLHILFLCSDNHLLLSRFHQCESPHFPATWQTELDSFSGFLWNQIYLMLGRGSPALLNAWSWQAGLSLNKFKPVSYNQQIIRFFFQPVTTSTLYFDKFHQSA